MRPREDYSLKRIKRLINKNGMIMLKKIVLVGLFLVCSSMHSAENKSVAINRKQVEKFFLENKISYSVVRDTYTKLCRLEEKAPATLIELMTKVRNDQAVVSLETAEWLCSVGLVDAQRASARCSLIHADVKEVIKRLVSELSAGESAFVLSPKSHFKSWPGR